MVEQEHKKNKELKGGILNCIWMVGAHQGRVVDGDLDLHITILRVLFGKWYGLIGNIPSNPYLGFLRS